jgi:AcrR family transcriptional regulator
MSTAYELEGRVAQKRRTRSALISAARELVAQGLSPTVEDAANASGISRTTAYRYFPNQAALFAAAHPESVASTLLPANPPDDPIARVALVVEAYTKVVARSEAQQRTMLRLSLESSAELPLRQGRAIGWLQEALEPARPALGDDGVRRLALAIRSATGIEALVWLMDIGGLSKRDAIKLMRGSATALCRDALAQAPPN